MCDWKVQFTSHAYRIFCLAQRNLKSTGSWIPKTKQLHITSYGFTDRHPDFLPNVQQMSKLDQRKVSWSYLNVVSSICNILKSLSPNRLFSCSTVIFGSQSSCRPIVCIPCNLYRFNAKDTVQSLQPAQIHHPIQPSAERGFTTPEGYSFIQHLCVRIWEVCCHERQSLNSGRSSVSLHFICLLVTCNKLLSCREFH